MGEGVFLRKKKTYLKPWKREQEDRKPRQSCESGMYRGAEIELVSAKLKEHSRPG